VSGKPVDDKIIAMLNEAFAMGVQSIDQLTFPAGVDEAVLRTYLHENIDYHFDEQKRKALELLLSMA
jgi:hypothetical protein